jgi:hypothetical protein
MPPKAVDARKHFNRNRRFRGHGPLLQKAWSARTAGDASTALVGGGHAPPKAVDARKHFYRNRRFRGRGPLLQKLGPIPRWVVHPPPL